MKELFLKGEYYVKKNKPTIMKETKEVMKVCGKLANPRFSAELKDVLIAEGIRAAFSSLIIFGIETVGLYGRTK